MDQVPMGKVVKLGIYIDMIYETIPLPRDIDACVMERFVELGIRGKWLVKLNKYRKRQEAIFSPIQ